MARTILVLRYSGEREREREREREGPAAGRDCRGMTFVSIVSPRAVESGRIEVGRLLLAFGYRLFMLVRVLPS